MSKKPNEEAVRELAYRLWEQRGRPHGRGEEDWFAAEKRLRGEGAADSCAVDESIRESFPASDAPSSNLPDQAPVNAEEKWAAADSVRKKRRAKRNPSDEPGRAQVDRAGGSNGRSRNP
jgi:hypothetical protein